MEDDKIYAFAFKGLLTNAALDREGNLSRHKFSDRWEQETSKRLGLTLLDDDLVASSRKMAIVYTAICAFENSVREFVEKKLLEEKGENWWDNSVNTSIRRKAADRKAAEKDVRWLTPRGNSLIYYTDFSDLISIIGSNSNWKYFVVHIGNIEWAKQIIVTLEKSRNIIMHSGELAPTDIERVGMFIRDWIRQVG